MESSRLKREIGLYALAFGVAIILRLLRLGSFPLTDLEAASALQALELARGTGSVGPHSAYVLLTSAFFFVFESSNFFARLAPALIGSLLVFAPMLFRHRLKPRTSLVMAFFLAFDPGMLALSRQGGSAIFAITFVLFAWGFWEQGRMNWAGVFAALALLGGPSLWPGLLGLGITWAILQGVLLRPAQEVPLHARRPALREFWPAFLATLVAFGTLFFLAPSGLGGIFSGLTGYLQNWVLPSGVPGLHLYLSLAFYQPLALLFALIGLVRGWWVGSRRVTRLSVWLLVSLLLAAFHPGRQVHDLAWTLIPLLALAALEISRNFDIPREERTEIIGVTLLAVILLVFAWFGLAKIIWDVPGTRESNLRMILLIGALFLLAVSLALVAVGWSTRVARLGGVWGMVIVLGLLTFSAGMGAGRIRVDYTSELWTAGTYPTHADLLVSSADQISEWGAGSAVSLPVIVSGVDSPALLWALRRHEVIVLDVLDASTSPSLLVTSLRDDPMLAAAYRGQDFTWYQKPVWDSDASQWLRWYVLREMPQSFDTILLWARDDLFIDSASRHSP